MWYKNGVIAFFLFSLFLSYDLFTLVLVKVLKMKWKRSGLKRKIIMARSSRPEVFLGKVVLKICSKFTEEYPCRSVISIKLKSNFIEITLWHGCSPVNLLHIFRTPFLKMAAC